MADLNTEEPLSNLSDSSFVILGQGSLPLNINNGYSNSESNSDSFSADKNNVSFLQMQSSTSGMTQSRCSAASSFFEGDTQEKLSQLLQENYHLRETLSQNNLAIKSQLDTFIMWQQEVLKTHETHKQKFLETRDLILKLRAENANLKKQMEESLHGLSIVNGDDTPTVNSGDCSLNKAKNLVNDQSTNMSMSEEKCKELTDKNKNLSKENYKLNEQLKDAENQISKLNRKLEDITQENVFLKQKIDTMRKNSDECFSHGSLPNSDARVQISNLFKQLEEEREKVLKLKDQLEAAKSSNAAEVKPKLSTTEELTQYINRLDDMNVSLDRQNQRFNTIISWVSLAEENLNTLNTDKTGEGIDNVIMSEIAQLKSHLTQEENAFKQKQENLQEIHGQFNKLLEDYKDLQKKLNLLETSGLNNQKYKDEITTLTEQLKAKDEALMNKQEECDKLKDDVKKLNLECEEVALLRVQVDLYQTDFNDERAAREKLVGEKEEMSEQIRLLQSKIEDLGKDKTNVSSSQSTTSSPSAGKKSRFVCPKCMFSFSDLERCEKHIDECLNIHMYP